MRRPITVLLTLTVALGLPLVGAQSLDNVRTTSEDRSTWGLCQAYYASTIGNEASNGTVHDAPAFDGVNASTCDDATAPWNGTAGDDYVPSEADDPGQTAPDEHPGQDNNPGDDHR